MKIENRFKFKNIYFLFLFLLSCKIGDFVQKPDSNLNNLYFLKNKSIKFKLRFDGCYQNLAKRKCPEKGEFSKCINEDSNYLENPIFFFNNGEIAFNSIQKVHYSSITDYLKFAGMSKRDYTLNWGYYEVDSLGHVSARIYVTFSHYLYLTGGIQRALCFFNGEFKNSDSLNNWQIVPPYPNVFLPRDDVVGNYNADILNDLKVPKNFVFKSVENMDLVDPTKSWINDFIEMSLRIKSKSNYIKY